ncbi:hypothetical protein BpHYR1_040821 [Brachionus plicatilis]|uniref:Uncharacterized protein n=1 Tax=Brachionus plicatilis TaxID=10195 RepID=A0A3M7RDP7_BRAPC|nr:hypothetical protein BpHYR1_040821 [Brachionus plicatilis]
MTDLVSKDVCGGNVSNKAHFISNDLMENTIIFKIVLVFGHPPVRPVCFGLVSRLDKKYVEQFLTFYVILVYHQKDFFYQQIVMFGIKKISPEKLKIIEKKFVLNKIINTEDDWVYKQ